MKMTVTESKFRDLFHSANRSDQFSYSGLSALYEYLEEIDPDYDLDIIELCTSYTEYESLEEYNKEYDPVDSIAELERITTVIMIDSESFIIANH